MQRHGPNRDSYGGHEKNQGWEYQNISVFVSGLLFWALHGSTKWSNPQGLNVTSHPIPCKSCPLLSFVLIEPRCLSISLCHMTPCFRAWSPLRSWPQPPKVTNSSPIVGWMATEAWPFKKKLIQGQYINPHGVQLSGLSRWSLRWLFRITPWWDSQHTWQNARLEIGSSGAHANSYCKTLHHLILGWQLSIQTADKKTPWGEFTLSGMFFWFVCSNSKTQTRRLDTEVWG